MTGQTPLYQIPYLVGSDPAKQIAPVSELQATAVEALLRNVGTQPLDSDLVDLVTRLNALEAALSTALATRPRFYRGVFDVPAMAANGSSHTETINLTPGGFTVSPVVIAMPQYPRYTASVSNITTQTASVQVRNNSSGSGQGTWPCIWVALEL